MRVETTERPYELTRSTHTLIQWVVIYVNLFVTLSVIYDGPFLLVRNFLLLRSTPMALLKVPIIY